MVGEMISPVPFGHESPLILLSGCTADLLLTCIKKAARIIGTASHFYKHLGNYTNRVAFIVIGILNALEIIQFFSAPLATS